ncbi:MAG: hypothetical protein AAF711_02270 [Planctomycetota bacterium]
MGYLLRFIKKLFGIDGTGNQSSGQAASDPVLSPDLDLLHREAKRLSRDGLLLHEEGEGEPIAYWHDLEPDELCVGFRHGDRWLHVYLDDEEGGRVESGTEPIRSDCPLHGEPYRFLPHLDTIFKQGSEAVEAFLAANDWSRDDSYNDHFPGPTAAAYERLWQENCPLYVGEVEAAIGPFQMPWPDDDWDEVGGLNLVLWTFRDAEPWVEVYQTQGGWIVKQRIT